MIDLIREIGQTLKHNKLRTALTGLAVAWGIFMLIVLLGMSRGVYNSFTEKTSPESSNTISIWGGITSKPHKGYREGRKISLKATDKPALMESDPKHIADVWQVKTVDSAYISTSRDYISGSLYGHYPQEAKRAKLNIIHGRFINQRDMDLERKVIVLEEKNAALLFGSASEALNKLVVAYGLSWQVIGIYTHDWENGTYIPFTTAISITGYDGTVSQSTVMLQDVSTESDGKNAETTIRETMSTAHNFAPDDNGGVYISNRFLNYLSAITATNILSIAVWLIGLLTLLSGIVGVSNIMFVSVRERTHEIGIRRAIGAKPRSILGQIVAESVAITTIFGYIGVVFGTGLTAILSQLFANVDFIKNPTVDLSTAFNVTIVLIFAGALAGLFPAIKATKVKPVEALRDE